MSHKLLTASRLRDGAVVYLDRDGGWSTRFSEGWVVDNDVDALAFVDSGRRAEAAQIVVGAYLMDVAPDGAAYRPIRMREIVRAEGPTAEPASVRPLHRAA